MCLLFCQRASSILFAYVPLFFFNESTVHGSDIRAVGQKLESPLFPGDSISIGCTVYVGENVEVQPSVSWTMPNGQQPEEQTDTYFVPQIGHVTGIAQSTLHISSLGVADAGRYQCRSRISVPMRDTTDIVNVKIQREDTILCSSHLNMYVMFMYMSETVICLVVDTL